MGREITINHQSLLDRIVQNKRSLIVANYIFWLLVIIISASQLFLRFKGQYDGGWFNFFWRQGVSWAGWALLTIPIVRCVEVIQQNVKARKYQIAVHSLAAVIFTLTYVFILSVLSVLFFDSDTPLKEFFSRNIFSAGITNLLVYALIAVFGFTLVFYRKNKEDETLKNQLDLKNRDLEKQLLEFKLSQLKMQIQPHFLFNSLHSVSSLVRKQEYEKAIDTVSLLSDLLRGTMNSQESDFVKLENEINTIQKYLSIEEIRFGENLKVNYEIDLKANDHLVPSLILQPIVENAFKHGFKNRKTGALTIAASKKEDLLEIKVQDNGEGLPQNFSLGDCVGIGLKNVIKRLDTIYGDQQLFRIENNVEDGVLVTIQIPDHA